MKPFVHSCLPVATVTVLMLAAAPAAGAGRGFAAAGSKTVAVKTLDATTQIVAPTAGGPYPLIIASHGFSANGDNQIGWAKHFASWGFVVAVPSFPSTFAPDTATNAGIIEGLVTQLQGAAATAQNVAKGPFGLEGHSAGGLATAVAALKIAPAATVLFDPVDRNADGKAAYEKLCTPVLAIFAGPSSCNNNGDWRTFGTKVPGDLLAFDVKGSTHCDGENNPRALCGGFCGGAANTDRQAVYAHYATAFLLAKLTKDAAATTALVDATVDADTDLDAVAHGVSTCASTPDAGAADGSAPASSSGGSSGSSGSSGTSGTSGVAAPLPEDDSAGSSSSDSGCQTAPGTASSVAWSAFSIALGALLVRARRKR